VKVDVVTRRKQDRGILVVADPLERSVRQRSTLSISVFDMYLAADMSPSLPFRVGFFPSFRQKMNLVYQYRSNVSIY